MTDIETTEPVEGEIAMTRAEMAYEMMLAGADAHTICTQLGYKDARAITTAISGQLQREAAFVGSDERTKLLALSLARLDKLRQAVWPGAMHGDPQSVDKALKIEAQYMKALGTDIPDAQVQKHTVLVVGGQEKDYIESLKELT